jgi:hypothetical protein
MLSVSSVPFSTQDGSVSAMMCPCVVYRKLVPAVMSLYGRGLACSNSHTYRRSRGRAMRGYPPRKAPPNCHGARHAQLVFLLFFKRFYRSHLHFILPSREAAAASLALARMGTTYISTATYTPLSAPPCLPPVKNCLHSSVLAPLRLKATVCTTLGCTFLLPRFKVSYRLSENPRHVCECRPNTTYTTVVRTLSAHALKLTLAYLSRKDARPLCQ